MSSSSWRQTTNTRDTDNRNHQERKSVRNPGLRKVSAMLAILVTLGLTMSACGGDNKSSAQKTNLVVFAASSLTGSFTTMESAFEKAHPNVNVVTSFDSSSVLVKQIQSGATADVMATADEESMQPLVDKSQVSGSPTTFATNHLIVVTPKDNPGKVTRLDSLSKVKFVLCDPSAPCGAASKKVLASAGISARPQSLEQNVKGVLAKVTSGNTDAGLVYVTDAKAPAGQVKAFPIPDKENVTTKDLIAVVKASKHAKIAKEWIDYVMSSAGRKVLEAAGFGAP
jgi:molybdate transport system substrate-binding protein